MAKIKLIFIILMMSFLFFLNGCGNHNDSEYGSEQPVGKTKNLLMWLVGSESQAKVIQKIGNEFFENKGVNFKCEAISWSDAHTKYLTSIAGGVTPDIGTVGLTWGTEFGSLGAMVDLASEFGLDTQEIFKKIVPGFQEAIRYKERIYGVPFDLSLQLMFYRNDIIPKAPSTWQELEDLLLSLKTKGKGMIFEWGSMSWIGYAPFLWQAGGDFYNAQHSASILDSPSAASALKFFGRLYTELGVPKAKIPLEQGLRTGDFPLAVSGNWKIDSLRLTAPEIKGKWSVALLPAGPTGKRTAFLGGRLIGIFSKSNNKRLAWEFIKHLFEPQAQLRIYAAAQAAQDSYLPSNMLSWDAPAFEPEFKKVLKLQSIDAKGPPPVLGWDESTRFIEVAIQRVILQDRNIKEELVKAAKEMNKLLRD